MARTVLGTVAVLLVALVSPTPANAGSPMCTHLQRFVKQRTTFVADVVKRKIAFRKIRPEHRQIFGHVVAGLQRKLKNLDKAKQIKVVFTKVTGCGPNKACAGSDIFEAQRKGTDKNSSSVVLHLPGGIDIYIRTDTTVTYD